MSSSFDDFKSGEILNSNSRRRSDFLDLICDSSILEICLVDRDNLKHDRVSSAFSWNELVYKIQC